ncbi:MULTISPECIES: hypothetical protein [Methanobacterium]|uniref:Uncharacterized protein n=1 Tax=Methanobacterium veterum TaxID=408577 RepID=A0A9E4ZW57_9EURY|nr:MULTISPECIES: hypothetical protein [Methanobacterium]MCZ3364374.1 hypothetical protein [Methanobacterium veterum]MCZ3372124.1 hypothetical protein [Methanobacterium veterum]
MRLWSLQTFHVCGLQNSTNFAVQENPWFSFNVRTVSSDSLQKIIFFATHSLMHR